MKKLLLSFAVVALTTLLLVSACKKGNDKIIADNQTISTSMDGSENQQEGLVAQFYNSFGPKVQKYNVDASRESSIALPAGGKISIPAGAFAVGGVPVTSGIVEVSVLDLPNRAAMALSGVNTLVGNQVLQSNGNFHIEAAAGGRPVDRNLVAGRPLKVEVPDRVRNGIPLNLFVGGPNQQNQFDWVPAQVPAVPASTGGTFNFTWPTTGWVNPDWFLRNVLPGTTTFTTLRVDLPNNPGPLSTYRGGTGNTTVLFVPQGRNVIIQIYTATATGVVSYANTIPVGINGRLLAYSVTTGGYFMATRDIVTTAANPMVETLTFTPTTAAALTAALTALSTY